MRVRKAKKNPAIKPRQRELSEKEKRRLQDQEATLLRMKNRGATEVQIGAELGIDPSTVRRVWQGAMAEWTGDHHRLVSKLFAEMLSAHMAEIRESYVWGVDDPGAAALVRHRARAAISRMSGHGNVSKIEHTGPQGGPILTAQALPADAAALVRAAFNGIEPYTGGDTDGGGKRTH